jgi:hypothetical protein
MKKPNTGKRRGRSRKGSRAPKQGLKTVDLGIVREQITNRVGNRAVEMVETTMDEVDKGHYLAMKYLFEMVGLCPATSPDEAPEEDSLAKTLLRRLGLPEEPSAGTEVAKECATNAAEPASDAVE